MPTCRSCNRAIRWAVTAKGRRIPLDASPSPTGNVELTFGGGEAPEAATLTGAALDAARTRLTPLYMPHHATCPQGNAWKRSGSKGRTIERRPR